MIYRWSLKRFNFFIFCLFLAGGTGSAIGQTPSIQQSIDQLEQYRNFGYRYTYRQKEFTDDTVVIHHHDVFQKVPQDKNYGYLFSLETLVPPSQFPSKEHYNGKTVISLNPASRTYYFMKADPALIGQSLIGRLYGLRSFLKDKPRSLNHAADTIIDGRDHAHLIVTTRDTVIRQEHYYTRFSLLIDKASNLPTQILSRAKYENAAGEPTYYYSLASYFNYSFNVKGMNLVSTRIPRGYHLPRPKPALLKPGTIAPDWRLPSASGQPVSLSRLKGKLVLMYFYFIGCHNSMEALGSLNHLYAKYHDRGLVITGISGRDKLKSVQQFSQDNQINYLSCLDGAGVEKAYHVEAFPTFYFIDQKGKITTTKLGYDAEFEAMAGAVIDGMLKK